jgi:hypothetical protein
MYTYFIKIRHCCSPALNCLILQVFMAAIMKMKALRYMVPRSLVKANRHFRGKYWLLHQGALTHSLPCWWRKYARLKRRSAPTRLHGTISEKALSTYQKLYMWIDINWGRWMRLHWKILKIYYNSKDGNFLTLHRGWVHDTTAETRLQAEGALL